MLVGAVQARAGARGVGADGQVGPGDAHEPQRQEDVAQLIRLGPAARVLKFAMGTLPIPFFGIRAFSEDHQNPRINVEKNTALRRAARGWIHSKVPSVGSHGWLS